VVVRLDPVLVNDGEVTVDARAGSDLLRAEGETQCAASVVRPRPDRSCERPTSTTMSRTAPSLIVYLKIVNPSGLAVSRRNVESEQTARVYEHIVRVHTLAPSSSWPQNTRVPRRLQTLGFATLERTPEVASSPNGSTPCATWGERANRG
jgi:hypothetical protein